MRSSPKRANPKATYEGRPIPESRAVANAASVILLSRKGQNPYDLDYHRGPNEATGEPECQEPDFWNDDETLIPEEELLEGDFFNCSACTYQYQLWERIVEDTGAAEFGRRAQAAFRLEEFIEQFRPNMRKIDAAAYRDVVTVRAERARLEAQDRFNQEQEAARSNVGK